MPRTSQLASGTVADGCFGRYYIAESVPYVKGLQKILDMKGRDAVQPPAEKCPLASPPMTALALGPTLYVARLSKYGAALGRLLAGSNRPQPAEKRLTLTQDLVPV
jgi:hypothetical protein